MKIYNGFQNVTRDPSTVLTVGSFDGVHRGHRLIIGGVLEHARGTGGRSMVVTFDPHPQEVLRKSGESVPILTTIGERIEQISALGIDALLVLEFTAGFSRTPWQEFCRELISYVGLSHIVVGHDHGFGKGREGSADLLKDFAAAHGFGVTDIGPLVAEGMTISSTKIRRALASGDLASVREYLGRDYSLGGTVVRGDGRGRALGIPTANIRPEHPGKLIPADGVYAVTVSFSGRSYRGMANIGHRPTFTDGTTRTIEVNLFDFDEDIYGTEIRMEFRKFVRFEQKFNSKEEFLEQLDRDRNECR